MISNPPSGRLLNTNEITADLRVAKITTLRLFHSGKIPGKRRKGGQWCSYEPDYLSFLIFAGLPAGYAQRLRICSGPWLMLPVEVAAGLGISKMTLYRLVWENRIGALRIMVNESRPQDRFPHFEFDNYLRKTGLTDLAAPEAAIAASDE
jgi:excisionase family DNA binding protein